MRASHPGHTFTSITGLVLGLCLAGPSIVFAQSLQQRIDHARRERAKNIVQQGQTPRDAGLNMHRRLTRRLPAVNFEQVPAKAAFQRWASASDVPLVISWQAMRRAGVDPGEKLSLRLSHVPARGVLRILMQQASPNNDLIYQTTPWYVQVMTKRQANRHNVVRLYPIGEIIQDVPNFDNAPRFDLNAALSNTNSGGSSSGQGGGGGSGGQSIFGDQDSNQDQDRQAPSRKQRAQTLVDAIQNTVEPTLWNSATGASMRYFNGKLIVNAPRYVQRQIGSSAGQPVGVAPLPRGSSQPRYQPPNRSRSMSHSGTGSNPNRHRSRPTRSGSISRTRANHPISGIDRR